MKLSNQKSYIDEIKIILSNARQYAYRAINSAMLNAYWLIGKRIVEEEQNGKERAAYGEEILKTVSKELSNEFGKGFSLTNIKNFKKFYLLFSDAQICQTLSDFSLSQIGQTSSDKLSWSHYERLIRIQDKDARNW
jgi:hypothetical protein